MSDLTYQGKALNGSLDELQQAVQQALAASDLSGSEREIWLQAMPDLLSKELPEDLEEQISDLKVQYDL
jgi:hypothetical protein